MKQKGHRTDGLRWRPVHCVCAIYFARAKGRTQEWGEIVPRHICHHGHTLGFSALRDMRVSSTFYLSINLFINLYIKLTSICVYSRVFIGISGCEHHPVASSSQPNPPRAVCCQLAQWMKTTVIAGLLGWLVGSIPFTLWQTNLVAWKIHHLNGFYL